ncbi:hypothetical protein BZA05DRAFT_393585 [Tricharina praecox]|uniref:uncharacterized protein n=1 Tax=Tricharina praecox TaxID=43433 RepID=UPI0022211FB1|nr:uncharacterized protein BZA05DRAFT_393585 [Tricharina praecox]KAI5854228.1 hypothetical protein BZA05DRAFT_393585 [Tricharina praecox]
MPPNHPPRMPPPPWVIDLKNLPANKPRPVSSSIPDPPGFSAPSGSKKSAKLGPSTSANPSETDDLFLKKAWEIALAPAKAIPMNAIMMYMSGNTLQIFSIMMTVMLFMNPIKALSTVGSTFSRFDNERTHARLWPVKLAFIALQIATIALGIWKVNGMGLLPTTRSDWLAWERERQPMEYSAPAFQAILN